MRRKTLGLALLTIASTTLSGCFKPKASDPGAVLFWSSFGGAYTTVLNGVVDSINSEKGLQIEHVSQGSYDGINTNMINAIGVGDYPNIAMGYPDHFATYLSSGILKPLDEYLTAEDIADYYSEYMAENYFYDDGGENAQKKIYALPFNKSTELLGYNGVFVDYCATIDSELANIPATWGEWETQGPKYDTIFKNLMGHKLYGKQDAEGKASAFSIDTQAAGTSLLIDFEHVDPNTSILMSWDATDNAFITLVRQCGAEYTTLPESEKTKQAKKRVGNIMFNSSENQPKVVEMLHFFNKLNKNHIFGTPVQLGGSYSSDAFAQAKVMFMICSSGGLSYNTAKWTHRFRVAPVPYFNASRKQVISQGANICMTDQGNFEESVAAIKALTTGKFQTAWCLETGYYPCSKSATNSAEYQAFMNEDKTLPAAQAYASPTRVAYREGSKLNNDVYMNASQGWTKFVDPAFKCSSELRTVIKGVLDQVFSIENPEDTASIVTKLNELKNAPALKGQSTIRWVD